MKKKKKYCIVIAVVFFVVCCLASPVGAETEAELKAKIKEAQQKKEEAQYQVDLSQDTVDGILAEIDKANAEIDNINDKVEALNQKIASVNDELQKTKDNLKKTEKAFKKQKKEAEERLCAAYMFSDDYFEILFSATDFGDFISKINSIAAISKEDNKKMDDLKALQKSIEKEKKEIEIHKQELVASKEEQNRLLADQKNIKAQLDELYAQNKAVLDRYKAEVEQYDNEIAAANESLAAKAAEEQRKIQEQQTGGGGGGGSTTGYVWPTTSEYITSYFGYRESPGGIGSTNHMGLDIGAWEGSPIYAVQSGRVICAEWYGGYGNCVEIAHSNGYTTLYGHMSSIAVSYGQYVSKGEIIGYVGSTGNSTGPHLHISFIDPYGNFVDPLNFL